MQKNKLEMASCCYFYSCSCSFKGNVFSLHGRVFRFHRVKLGPSLGDKLVPRVGTDGVSLFSAPCDAFPVDAHTSRSLVGRALSFYFVRS
jgi:hypothetical protein